MVPDRGIHEDAVKRIAMAERQLRGGAQERRIQPLAWQREPIAAGEARNQPPNLLFAGPIGTTVRFRLVPTIHR